VAELFQAFYQSLFQVLLVKAIQTLPTQILIGCPDWVKEYTLTRRLYATAISARFLPRPRTKHRYNATK
jgi:hypothetical protein